MAKIESFFAAASVRRKQEQRRVKRLLSREKDCNFFFQEKMPWHQIDVSRFCEKKGLKKTLAAQKFAYQLLKTLKTKDERDVFMHSYRLAQILIYHMARAGVIGKLISIEDLDNILSAAFNHDDLEDVSWNALHDIEYCFGDLVALFVWVLSRDDKTSDVIYFLRIADFIFSALIKLADRLHNLRNMAKNLGINAFFTKERLSRQIEETWRFIVPMALKAMDQYEEYKPIIEDMLEELILVLAEAEYVLQKA
ncbi:MAG: hypothetical protein WC823_04940 [Parcubacteria group bacterium]|jgi:(p)ppGpp synthase/HD superfamily hydrolase